MYLFCSMHFAACILQQHAFCSSMHFAAAFILQQDAFEINFLYYASCIRHWKNLKRTADSKTVRHPSDHFMFWELFLTLSLNNITELVSKKTKLATVIEIFIECTFIKFLPIILKENHTISSISSLTYFQMQLLPVPYYAF